MGYTMTCQNLYIELQYYNVCVFKKLRKFKIIRFKHFHPHAQYAYFICISMVLWNCDLDALA